MNTLETIMARRSIRRYRAEAIPEADLKKILEAGHQAPAAANRQPWHFVVVSDPALKKAVAEACNGQMWMADAACILVAVGLPEVTEKWYKVDVAIAMENMVLAAAYLGYGTCWIAPSIRPRSRNSSSCRPRPTYGVFSAGRARRTAGSPPPQGLGRGLFQGHLRQAARLSDAVPGCLRAGAAGSLRVFVPASGPTLSAPDSECIRAQLQHWRACGKMPNRPNMANERSRS
jgi:hypothetical protein